MLCGIKFCFYDEEQTAITYYIPCSQKNSRDLTFAKFVILLRLANIARQDGATPCFAILSGWQYISDCKLHFE